MNFKNIVSKDKSQDLFKDCLYDTSKQILKEDITNWVHYKFKRFTEEKTMRKIENLLRSKIL